MSEQEPLIPYGHRGKVAFNCVLCKDRGKIIARLKIDGSNWAFICPCPIGRRSKYPFPLWPGENAGFEAL